MKHIVIIFCMLAAWLAQPGGAAADDPLLVMNPRGHSSQISAVMFTPDGGRLISTSYDKTIRVWDARAGDLLTTLRHQIGPGREGEIHAAALSPDGTVLAVGGVGRADQPADVPVYLFDLDRGDVIGVLAGHSDVIMALAFSSDGAWLVSGAEQTIRLWNLERITDGPAFSWQSDSRLFDLALSPDDGHLATGHVDASLRVWELPPLEAREPSRGPASSMQPAWVTRRHESVVGCVAWSPDGRYLVSGDFYGQYYLWNGASGRLANTFEPTVAGVTAAFSPDSRQVAISNGNVAEVYTVPDLRPVAEFDRHADPVPNSAFSNNVTAMAFRDNRVLATAGGNGYEMYVWQTQTGEALTHITGQGQRVQAVGLHESAPDGGGLIVGIGHAPGGLHQRGSVEQAFDVDGLRLWQTLPPEMAFSRPRTTHAGRTLVYTPGHADPDDWYALRITGGGIIRNSASDGWVRAYTFTPDGNVVVGSSHVLRLHGPDGRVLQDFVGHTGEVWDVAVSADGSLLVSGSDDQTVKFWNLRTGECLATLFVARDHEWICWTPQGYYAASAGGEQYVGWQVNQGRARAALYYAASAFRPQRYHPELVKAAIRLRSFEAAFEAVGDVPAPPAAQGRARSVIVPPLVEWLEPRDPALETTAETLRVRVKVRSDHTVADNEINQIKLLVNGRAQATLDQMTLTGRPSPFYKEVFYDVPLVPGKNEIHVFAATPHAGAPSEKRVVLRGAADDDWQKPDVYLVSVGISDYPMETLKLNYADDDARAIARLFRAQAGKLYREAHLKELYDGEATEANIVAALQWLESRAGQGDVVVVFIAAHGFRSGRRQYYYILPVDGDPERLRATGVDWGVFAEILGNLPARVLLLLDTCHSGQLGVNLLASGAALQPDNTEALRTLASDEYGVVILAASTGDEASQEHPEWEHGAFTAALLEALEQGLADYPPKPDGIIHLRELDLYVDYRVRELTGETQHPTTQKPSTITRFPIVQFK